MVDGTQHLQTQLEDVPRLRGQGSETFTYKALQIRRVKYHHSLRIDPELMI